MFFNKQANYAPAPSLDDGTEWHPWISTLRSRTPAVESGSKSLASRFAYTVSKRIAALLLPLGFGLGDFVAAAKAAFVDAAAEHIRRRGHRPSTARIAVLTGMTRAEVARVRETGIGVPRPFTAQRTERVMHGWFTDPDYVTTAGEPRPLKMTGTASLESLVRKYSGDIPRRAVLEELIAGGMARVDAGGAVVALRRHYLAPTSRSEIDLDQLTHDAAVFFGGALAGDDAGTSTIRRVSVEFPGGVPASIRRTVALRTERFLEALADYLHSATEQTHGERREANRKGPVLHIMITQSELDDGN